VGEVCALLNALLAVDEIIRTVCPERMYGLCSEQIER